MKRVILKISGEVLKSDNENVSKDKLEKICKIVSLLKERGICVGIVSGGGNFFRGREHTDMNQVERDTIGMLGTVMNALYIKDYLSNNNIDAVVSTPFNFNKLISNYKSRELKKLYDKGTVIVFGGGVGKCGYSTDSGTILASQILNSKLIIKLTKVDGIYDKDPELYKDVIKYDYLKYDEVLDKDIKVMDKYAVEMCKEKNIKILVMSFNKYDQILKYFDGINIGTEVGD